MALPKAKCPTRTLTVDGEEFEVRGLTRTEAVSMGKTAEDNPEAVDAQVLSFGAGVPVAEAVEWLDSAPLTVATEVITAILELSGMGDDTPKG